MELKSVYICLDGAANRYPLTFRDHLPSSVQYLNMDAKPARKHSVFDTKAVRKAKEIPMIDTYRYKTNL